MRIPLFVRPPRAAVAVRRSVVLLAAAAVLATACTGGGAGGPAGEPGGRGYSLPPQLDQVLRPSERTGGTLRVVAEPGCDSWDPQRVVDAACWDRQRWVARQLLTYAPEAGHSKLVGDLAEAVPSSPDLRRWTYRLRAGLRFEDGTPITSRDVKYGIERAFAAGAPAASPAGYVVELLDDPRAPYPGPYADTDAARLGLASVETPDDKTVTFHLARPFADWNALVATLVSTPVPREADDVAGGGAGYGRRPVASGPYRLDTVSTGASAGTLGVSASFVRNPQWDRESDPNRAALPDRILVVTGLDQASADARLLDGAADLRLGADGVGPKLAGILGADAGLLSRRALSVPTGAVSTLALVTTAEPFDDVHCRRAVAWAVDRAGQRDARGGPLAGGEVATTMLPPGFAYRTPSEEYPSAGGHGDLVKAAEELAACGMPGGFAVRLAAASAPRERAQAQALAVSLARVGIEVEVVPVEGAADGADVMSRLGAPGAVRRGGYGMALVTIRGAWPAPYPLFRSFVDARVGGREVAAAGDVAAFHDPVASAALAEGAAARDEPSAPAAWNRLDQAVVSQAAYVPLVYDHSLQLFGPRVTNVMFSPPFANVDVCAVGVVP